MRSNRIHWLIGLCLGATASAALATSADAAYRLRLGPADSTTTVGSPRTLTATLTNDGVVVPGQLIVFAIIGPNAGAAVTCMPAGCMTDASGHVRFTYTGTNAGTDTLTAFVDLDRNGVRNGVEDDVDCSANWTGPATTTTTVCPPGSTTTAHATTTTSTTAPSTSSTTTSTPPSSTTTTTPATSPIGTSTTTSSSTTSTTLPPFQCYEIKNFRFPRITGVAVDDGFGSFTTTLTRPHKLCAPAGPDDGAGGGAFLPGHLTAYPNGADFVALENVTVTDRFGTLHLDVLRPDYVLAPSAKSLDAAPPPGSVPDGPAYECYRVEKARGAAGFVKVPNVAIEDPFGAFVASIAEPRRLCAPASIDGADPGAPASAGHLMCYRIQTKSRFKDARVFLRDQFGTLSVRLIRRQELCVEATVEVP